MGRVTLRAKRARRVRPTHRPALRKRRPRLSHFFERVGWALAHLQKRHWALESASYLDDSDGGLPRHGGAPSEAGKPTLRFQAVWLVPSRGRQNRRADGASPVGRPSGTDACIRDGRTSHRWRRSLIAGSSASPVNGLTPLRLCAFASLRLCVYFRCGGPVSGSIWVICGQTKTGAFRPRWILVARMAQFAGWYM